jgi:hypothetical protein
MTMQEQGSHLPLLPRYICLAGLRVMQQHVDADLETQTASTIDIFVILDLQDTHGA